MLRPGRGELSAVSHIGDAKQFSGTQRETGWGVLGAPAVLIDSHSPKTDHWPKQGEKGREAIPQPHTKGTNEKALALEA